MRSLFIVIIALCILGCSDGETKRQEHARKVGYIISKKWKYDGDAIMEMVYKMNLDNRDIDISKLAVERMRNGVFEFKEDGNVFLAINDGGIPGTWSLSPDCSLLDLALIGGSKIPERVDTIGENYIRLQANDKEGRVFPKILIPAE